MKPTPQAEVADRLRRKFIRFKFHADAEIVRGSAKIPCRVTDISRGGMFIEVANPPQEGTSFMLRLALNVPLRLACVVRRVVADVGVGVTFTVGTRERKRFDALLLALMDPLGPGCNQPSEEVLGPPQSHRWSAGEATAGVSVAENPERR